MEGIPPSMNRTNRDASLRTICEWNQKNMSEPAKQVYISLNNVSSWAALRPSRLARIATWRIAPPLPADRDQQETHWNRCITLIWARVCERTEWPPTNPSYGCDDFRTLWRNGYFTASLITFSDFSLFHTGIPTGQLAFPTIDFGVQAASLLRRPCFSSGRDNFSQKLLVISDSFGSVRPFSSG